MTVLHWATKGKYGRHKHAPSRTEWARHRAMLRQEWLETPADPMQFHLDWIKDHKEYAVGSGLPRVVDWTKVPPEKWAQIKAEIYNYQQPEGPQLP